MADDDLDRSGEIALRKPFEDRDEPRLLPCEIGIAEFNARLPAPRRQIQRITRQPLAINPRDPVGNAVIWREGEKKTKLIKTPGGGYNLIFTVREDKYLY